MFLAAVQRPLFPAGSGEINHARDLARTWTGTVIPAVLAGDRTGKAVR